MYRRTCLVVYLDAGHTLLKSFRLFRTPHVGPENEWREWTVGRVNGHHAVHGRAYADGFDVTIELCPGLFDDLQDAIGNYLWILNRKTRMRKVGGIKFLCRSNDRTLIGYDKHFRTCGTDINS